MSRARPADALADLARSRWAGAPVGRVVPCRSPLIGRTVSVRVRGKPGKQDVEVTACVVPKSERASKGRRPDYRVREAGPALFPFTATVDGGRVRNATRTPRAFHPAGPWEFVNGQFLYGPVQAMAVNEAEGLSPLEGLDVPYPHRVGSHVCCPDHSSNALRLAGVVRDEYETEGALSASTRRALAGLVAHLRKAHRAKGLPSSIEADDFQGAEAITAAGVESCAELFARWQEDQTQHNAEYRAESKRKRKRAKSAARRAAKSAAVDAVVGVKAKRALAALSRRNAGKRLKR